MCDFFLYQFIFWQRFTWMCDVSWFSYVKFWYFCSIHLMWACADDFLLTTVLQLTKKKKEWKVDFLHCAHLLEFGKYLQHTFADFCWKSHILFFESAVTHLNHFICQRINLIWNSSYINFTVFPLIFFCGKPSDDKKNSSISGPLRIREIPMFCASHW